MARLFVAHCSTPFYNIYGIYRRFNKFARLVLVAKLIEIIENEMFFFLTFFILSHILSPIYQFKVE
jgi:hypothetical protein